MSKKAVTVSLVVLALIGGGYFQWTRMQKAKVEEEKKRVAGLSLLFDRTHLVAYSELKNVAAVKKIYGMPKDKALADCFKKKGRKCKSKARAPEAWGGPKGEHQGTFTLLGVRCDNLGTNDCVVKRTTMMKLFCPNDKECASVEVMFASEYAGKDKLKARRSLMAISPNELLK